MQNKAGKPNTIARIAGNASPASAARRCSPFNLFSMLMESERARLDSESGPCEIACGECLLCRHYDHRLEAVA